MIKILDMKVISIPKKVNSSVVRLVAGQVFLLSLLFVFTRQPLFAGILVIDFAIRALGYPLFSPLALAGRLLSDSIHMKPKPVFFHPKRFAAAIGFFLSLTALILLSAGAVFWSVAVTALLLFFSFLESFFGFCAGCKIYAFLVRNSWISAGNCPDCVQ